MGAIWFPSIESGCAQWNKLFDRQSELLYIYSKEEINAKDKGGMIFSPRVGLHESVVVLDYENEYANLIVRQNLETVNSQ